MRMFNTMIEKFSLIYFMPYERKNREGRKNRNNRTVFICTPLTKVVVKFLINLTTLKRVYFLSINLRNYCKLNAIGNFRV